MLKDKRLQGLLLFICLAGSVFAQTNTNTPYSRFGLGKLGRSGFDQSLAMGGIGIGMHEKLSINYMNPASYSSIDTLSFLFDFGLSGSYNTLETENGKTDYFAANLDHIALGFPISKWGAVSFGVLPFSKVGYNLKEEAIGPGLDLVDYYNSGRGGINQLYMGTAFEFFESFSVGANVKYLFGNIQYQRSLRFPFEESYSAPKIENNIILKDFLFEFGTQFYKDIGDKFELTLGATYGKSSSLSAENILIKMNFFQGAPVVLNDSTDLTTNFILAQDTIRGTIDIPATIGLGLSIKYNNRLLLGFDYTRQDWSDATILDQSGVFTKSSSYRAGLEYMPNPDALRGYLNWIKYRAGAYYSNSYLKLNEKQLKYYGISFGAGLPLRGGRSSFNITCDMGRRGTELNREATLKDNLVLENYMFISFSVTLHDIWFFKTKFD